MEGFSIPEKNRLFYLIRFAKMFSQIFTIASHYPIHFSLTVNNTSEHNNLLFLSLLKWLTNEKLLILEIIKMFRYILTREKVISRCPINDIKATRVKP